MRNHCCQSPFWRLRNEKHDYVMRMCKYWTLNFDPCVFIDNIVDWSFQRWWIKLPKNGMLFMVIMIIVMTGIMIIANTNYQYRATLLCTDIFEPKTTSTHPGRVFASICVRWAITECEWQWCLVHVCNGTWSPLP